MERPFDYPSSSNYEIRTAASCAAKVRECVAYIRRHNLTGERLATWQGFVRNWRAEQARCRAWERRFPA